MSGTGAIIFDTKAIIKNIRAIRSRIGLTQEEVAARLGMTQAAYGAWEIGRKQLTLENLERIAGAFECDLADIIGGGCLPPPVSGNSTVTNMERNDLMELLRRKDEQIAQLLDQNRELVQVVGRLAGKFASDGLNSPPHVFRDKSIE